MDIEDGFGSVLHATGLLGKLEVVERRVAYLLYRSHAFALLYVPSSVACLRVPLPVCLVLCSPIMAYLTNLTALFSTLITANHILSQQGILDAYGHISVRNPNNASTFFLARDLAPALVSSPADIVEYRTMDAQPVATNAPSGYVERYIHSETLKRWPGVNSVIHSHVEDVIPFGVSGVPFKAVGQDGSVLGV